MTAMSALTSYFDAPLRNMEPGTLSLEAVKQKIRESLIKRRMGMV